MVTGQGEAFMTHPVSLIGAVAFGIVLASSSADAQTAHHRVRHAAPAGRQITVHKGVEPWLTMGTWAPVGSRNGYTLDTFRPSRPTANQPTVVGVRGLERLPNDRTLPQANRPLIDVAWPGSPEPLFSWH